MLPSLRQLLAELSPRRRRHLGVVLLLMFAGAVAEVVSLGAILPFLAVLVSPERVTADSVLGPLFGMIGLDGQGEVVLFLAAVFAASAVLASGVRLTLAWASQRFVYGVAQELGVAVYDRTLHQPYAYHVSHNTSETLAAINKAQMLTGLLVSVMQAVTGSVIATFILLGLLYVDPVVALGSGLGFGALYLLVIAVTRATMRRNGVVVARAQKERIQAVGEGLGGIRDVLLDRSQPVFVHRFAAVERKLRRAQATNNFIAGAPRFVIEGLGLVLVAGLAVLLSRREGGIASAIPVLGALALGAQRMVPLLQQIYTGWAACMTGGQVLRDVLGILHLPKHTPSAAPATPPIRLEREIRLDAVDFSYPGSGRPALSNVDLVLPKGTRIGFVGKTGSGKSTLMDIVLGLLEPTSGRVFVDGVPLSDENRPAWQAQVAHVPQAIYLADTTIAENIAFGVPPGRIDRERVRAAAERASLTDVIDALPQRFDTLVGERGVRLSGGQRQRIGIARALYKQASVLVFDEATSALDSETEAAVMKSIEALGADLTILIIAHRLTTVAGCQMVVRVEGGRAAVQSATIEPKRAGSAGVR